MQKHVYLTSSSRLPTKTERDWTQIYYFNLFTGHHSEKKKEQFSFLNSEN